MSTPIRARSARRIAALLCAMSPAIAQDAAADGPTVADVLAVVDAQELDVPAFESLIRHGRQATPALVSALSAATADDGVRARRLPRILRALRAIGPAAAEAGPKLIDQLAGAELADVPALLDTLSATVALGDDPANLHDAASKAWSPFVKPGDQGFLDRLKGAIRLHVRMTQALPIDDAPTLVGALESPDPYVRELAAELLGRIGPTARPTLPALEVAAESTEHPKQARLPNHSLGTDFGPTIRSAAQIAIARIAPNDRRAADGLAALLAADDPRDRIEAAMALGRLGAKTGERPLLGVLGDEDPRLVAEAVTALGMIGADSPRTIDAIRKIADHRDRGVRARARATLHLFGVELPENRKG